MFLSNYLSILIFFFSLFILAIIIFFIPYIFAQKNYDKEKLSSYECGFNPFLDSRNEFEIKFYLVSILFIIFDLEITFLFPFLTSLNIINLNGVFVMYIFITILTIGFFYEWKKGALDWN